MKDKLKLATESLKLRHLFGEDEKSPIDIFSLLHSIENLTLIKYPMGKNISGMCIKGDNDIIIAVNSSMTYGRQRFTIAHELYHVYYNDGAEMTICNKNIGNSNDNNIEKEADNFASFLLIPPVALSEAIDRKGKKLDITDVVRLEQFFGVSRQAMLFRLVDENILTSSEAKLMMKDVILSAQLLGYSDELYRALPEEKQKMTYGKYIKQSKLLLEKNIISSGKYEELLLEAFRPDIVYGFGNEEGELFD